MGAYRILIPAALAAVLSAQTDWPVYGHDDGGMRYSPLKQINAGNVSKLERAWTYHTGELSSTAFETTPLVIGGVLYLSTPASRVIALDPETGRELWKYDSQANVRGKVKYHAHRGVAYWPGDRLTPPRILLERWTAG